MRFIYTVTAALLATVATAQNSTTSSGSNNAISIPEGSSTLDVSAGQPLTIDWTNPSDGTVTIKLQQDPITPDGGITLASGIPASMGSATLQIPDGADVNTFQYTIEIIDDSNPDNINFSPNFGIVGATGTSTGTAATASATGSTSTGSRTASSSETTDSSSASTTDSSASSSTGSASTTSSRSSASSTAASASQTTSAPDSSNNGAGGLKVQGGLFALAVGVMAAVM